MFKLACKGNASSGLSLVEIVISLALMGVLFLSIFTLTSKVKNSSLEMGIRMQTLQETEAILQAIRRNLQMTTAIHPGSNSQKLVMTVMDENGNPMTIAYRINSNFLQRSYDGGDTWESPYSMSTETKYRLDSGKFLFCGYGNNCTEFTDTNGNGDYEPGVDAAGTLASGYSGTALSSPDQAVKIALSDFVFNRQVGNPVIKRTVLTSLVHLYKPFMRTSSPLLQSFITDTTNSSFGSTAFDVRGLYYDLATSRLAVVGRRSSGTNVIYFVDRDGVLIDTTVTTGVSGIQLDSVCMESDLSTLVVLDSTASKVYRVDSTSNTVLTTITTTSLTPSAVSNPRAVACDPLNPDNFYLIGTASGSIKILERNKSTGSSVNTWSVPAGLTNPAGMFVDPLTGHFYVVQNSVSGSGSNRTITIYKIDRSSPTTTDTFTINLADIGSSATNATTNFWGLAYDPNTNHLFLSDTYSDRIYEIVPDRLISPRL